MVTDAKKFKVFFKKFNAWLLKIISLYYFFHARYFEKSKVQKDYAMENREDDLLHEVNEQLQWERFEKIAKEYGTYIIGAVLAIILSVSGYVYWNHSKLTQAQELSEKYTNALAKLGLNDNKEAIEQLKTLSSDPSSYGMLSKFVRASILVDNAATRPEAVAIYKEMIDKKDIDRRYRNLAIIFYVLAVLDEADPKELEKLMDEASIGTNMWPETTAEISALIAIRNNNMEKATKILTELKDNQQISQGARLRSIALLQSLPQTK